ncbi:MAG TPA: N-acetylmuramoyl-L-alanine amidase [Candidatus Limnocylindria bacterium]|jgi:N-acetylmuramoyl-L-alanine amidase|nr:N-acetylmuramoyl-L-alanine amidase [Candidatus Limnocylindria bacterium]
MRFPSWWLSIFAWACVAQASLTESPYRDLIEWGHLQGLVARSSADEVRLTNRWTALWFKSESKRILFGGVEVRLCDPVVLKQGRLRISQRDIEKTLNPLLEPPQRSGKAIRTVVVNAGHGGKDPGNMEGRKEEKVFTLALATEVKRQLEHSGIRVIMVRGTDNYVEREERAAIANRGAGDLYVSLHFNTTAGAADGKVQGLETYCLTPVGAASSNDTRSHGGGRFPGNAQDRLNLVFAQMVHRAILDATELTDRGVRRARFKELTLVHMPGILVEGGYMNHPHDSRLIYSPAGRAKLAEGIVDGILAYKRLLERG